MTNSPGFSVFRTAWSTTNRFSSSPWWIESCVTSVSAAAVDIAAIKIRLRYGLRGLSFFGLIEPAYYANLEEGIYPQRRCISWHLHALVWGISQRKLRALLRALQAAGRYVAVVPGLKAVDVRAGSAGRSPNRRRVYSQIAVVGVPGHQIRCRPATATCSAMPTAKSGHFTCRANRSFNLASVSLCFIC